MVSITNSIGTSVSIEAEGYLNVCICDCIGKADLKKLLEQGHQVLLNIEKDGKIVPLDPTYLT